MRRGRGLEAKVAWNVAEVQIYEPNREEKIAEVFEVLVSRRRVKIKNNAIKIEEKSNDNGSRVICKGII